MAELFAYAEAEVAFDLVQVISLDGERGDSTFRRGSPRRGAPEAPGTDGVGAGGYCRTGSNEPRFRGSGYRAAGAGQLAFLKTSFETSRGIRTEVDGRAWTRLILLI
jgi:hypothetical protein